MRTDRYVSPIHTTHTPTHPHTHTHTQAMGQYVGANSNRAFGGRARSGQRSSREATIRNGRKIISFLATSLGINSNGQIVKSAHRVFKMCSEENMIQGRHTQHICAVCLYVVFENINREYHSYHSNTYVQHCISPISSNSRTQVYRVSIAEETTSLD